MELWQAVIVGLVEGITEFLPVSSTGHLILTNHFLGFDKPETKSAVDAFSIVVQGGAILAVAGAYWPRVRSMIRGLMGKDNAGLSLLINIMIAFVPAAAIGLILHSWIESRLFFAGPVIAAVIVGGIYMLLVDQWLRGRFGPRSFASRSMTLDDLSPRQALSIGLWQCIAMWPGTSRSMMGITGGTFVGLRARDAAEFSFLLGLPTLGAAMLYTLYKDLRQSDHPNMFHVLGTPAIVVGLLVATVSAFLAVRWLVGFLNKHGMALFGWYRLVLGAAMLTLVLRGTIDISPSPKAEPSKATSIASPASTPSAARP